jgi:hypothetical protein
MCLGFALEVSIGGDTTLGNAGLRPENELPQ